MVLQLGNVFADNSVAQHQHLGLQMKLKQKLTLCVILALDNFADICIWTVLEYVLTSFCRFSPFSVSSVKENLIHLKQVLRKSSRRRDVGIGADLFLLTKYEVIPWQLVKAKVKNGNGLITIRAKS
ncbi:hypothetical protein AAE478_009276 [Parahypoxylon ruwenzoriense]